MGMVNTMENKWSHIEKLLDECDRQANLNTGAEIKYAEKALELSKALGYDIGIFEGHFRIARTLMAKYYNEDALEHLHTCYAIAQTLGDTLRIARTANSFGIAYYNLGITSKSLDYLLEALELSKSNGYKDIECRVYNNISNILIEIGDYETAVSYLMNILNLCQSDRTLFPRCIVYRNLAQSYYHMERIGDAEYYARKALEDAKKDMNTQIICESYYILGQVTRFLKYDDQAYSLYTTALDLADESGNDYYRVQIRIELSKLLCAQNDLDNASEMIHYAYRLAQKMDYPILRRNVALVLADICERLHDKNMLIEALTSYKEITRLLEDESNRRQQVFTKAQLMLFNLKKDNERLRSEIERDALTGCLSSRTFPDRVMQSLTTYGHRGALIFLDVDNLKQVNDTYGHDAGDALLKSFAHDLMNEMPQESLKIRIAGDEFLVFIPRAGKKEATETLDKLIKALAKPRMIGNVMMPVLVSAGIALYPEHSSDIMSLRKMADAAMYSAKQAGRGRYRVYNAS
jgi:diguanylate cyclase (GGDEF)-like protein